MMDKNDDLPGLPRGWVWTRVGEISKRIHYGYTAKSSNEKLGPKLLRITDIQNNSVNWDTVPYCSISEEDKEKYLLNGGDLVFARTGATVGKSFLIFGKIPEAVFASYLIRIILSTEISNKFVYNYFQSLSYWQQISTGKLGVGQPNVNAETLSRIVLPLPPLLEQKRIVAKIEELFTGLDAGIEALKKAKAQLKRYRQAVLKHAFEGRLTEEWREAHKGEVEPASILLERIKEERKKGKQPRDVIARSEGNEAISEDGIASPSARNDNLPKLPEGWVWTRPGEIGQVETGTTPSKSKIEYYGKDYPFYKPPDLNAGYCTSGSADGLTINGIKEARLLPAKSILITCIGATIGKTGFIKKEGAFNQQINAIIPMGNILPEYIYFICISPQFQKSIIKNASATTLPILSKRKFEILLLPLPPLVEQHKIVEEIERRFSVAEEVEKTIGQGLKQAERLRQSILKRAFEGKLVPQDPSDEPAGVLLEKIHLQRQQTEKDIKPRRKKARG